MGRLLLFDREERDQLELELHALVVNRDNILVGHSRGGGDEHLNVVREAAAALRKFFKNGQVVALIGVIDEPPRSCTLEIAWIEGRLTFE